METRNIEYDITKSAPGDVIVEPAATYTDKTAVTSNVVVSCISPELWWYWRRQLCGRETGANAA